MGNRFESLDAAADALYAAARDAGVDVDGVDWRLAVPALVTADPRPATPDGYTFDPVDPAALRVALERFCL